MKLIGGRSHPELVNRISSHLEHPITEVHQVSFPDGEFFCKIEDNIRGDDVFIIQSTCTPANQNIMELLVTLDACRRASASRITAVIPYFGYARQDRKDQPRVPITARLVADLLETAGANRVLAMDFHSEQIQGFFTMPVDHLYAYPVLVRHLRDREISNLVVASPDAGGFKQAFDYSTMLDCGVASVSKQRKNASEVTTMNFVGDVEGCNVVLVDDMTSTAGTLSAAAEVLMTNGAISVIAVVTHCLLNEKGVSRLEASAISELITTDSIPDFGLKSDIPITRISIAPLLADAITRIHGNQSVSSLFKI